MQPRPLHAFGLGAVIAAALVGAVVLLAPSRRMRPERHFKPVERLSDTVRAALRTQMRTHARGMLELVSAVTVLDYEAVGVSTQRLLEEPRVARPLTGDANELNGALPARFFEQQDDLRGDLQSLDHAAAARDP